MSDHIVTETAARAEAARASETLGQARERMELAARARLDSLFGPIAGMVERAWDRAYPKMEPNPFDTPEGRAAQWEQMLHLLGYQEIPAELSAERLEQRYATRIATAVQRRRDRALLRDIAVRLPWIMITLPVAVLRGVIAFWTEKF